MAEQRYEILTTQPTVYNDTVSGIVNGVLVRFRLTDYDEVHEVRIPKMDAELAKTEISKVLAERDALAGLTASKTK